METLIVKIKEPLKAQALVEMLKSMDFVSSVDYFDNLQETRRLFDEVNQIAAATELQELTMEDINAEIKAHRLEKKSGRN